MDDILVNIKINKIRELSFLYIEPDDAFIKSFDESILKIGMNARFGWNLDKDIFGIIIMVNYNYNSNSILDFGCQTEFIISNFKNIFTLKEDKSFTMDDKLLHTLVSMAVANARGMLASRTSGRFIHQFYIPPMDIKPFLDNITSSKIQDDGKRVVKFLSKDKKSPKRKITKHSTK